MTRQTRMVFLAGTCTVFAAVGCGKSPLAPTEVADVAATSVPSIAVVPAASVVASGREEGRVRLSSVTNDPITITVLQFPSLHTTVNLGETAVITGLPPGSYTLVFTQNGVVIATQSIVGVQPGEQIQITVVFDGGSFVMVVVVIGSSLPPPTPCTVDGHATGEIMTVEGVVVSGTAQAFREDRNGTHDQDLFDIEAATASYVCVGRAQRGSCTSSLGVGSQVHVTGALLGCRGTVPVLNATEVKIQKP